MKSAAIRGPLIKYLYYRFIAICNRLHEVLIPPVIIDHHEIPIFINNFNRLGSLKKLIEALESRGYYRINIIDNNSNYPPLLEFYKSCKYNVISLERNLGMNAFWLSGIYEKYKHDFFVYSDSDIVPIDECPSDFLLFFLQTLKKYPLARKVGFSLKIDDLPDHYSHKDEVLYYETHFSQDYCRDGILYWAPIDTTFALYRPRTRRKHANGCIEMYRTGFPYMARHLPWYINSDDPDEETRYYLEHLQNKTSWSHRSKSLLSSQGNK